MRVPRERPPLDVAAGDRLGLGWGLAKTDGFRSNGAFIWLEQGALPMAIRIKARGGESVEQMLRRFKKLCEKEGLTKEIKRRQYYEKPSERRRRALRKSIQRAIRAEQPKQLRPPR
ncbi:MAG: 30S ribosomal protein S21, partial [Phycisphaerales bacterium]